MSEPVAHAGAKCCWCGGPLYRVGSPYWCKTPACAEAQRAYAMGAKGAGGFEWIYVPLPIQVEAERQRRKGRNDGRAFNVLAGGAAGTAKSMSARWSMYRRALSMPGYQGLLLRKTFPELEKTHLLKMSGDEALLRRVGVDCEFRETRREFRFGNGSRIECGHLDDAKDVEKYLSTEYDDIVPDEASTFAPGPLFALASRARTSNDAVLDAGGPWFRPLTNPGGPSARRLVDFFVDHTPDFESLPEAAADYDPDLWRFVPSTLEDNPYISPGYAAQLALSHLDNPVRFRQLRFGDWRVIEGQFFTAWRETKDGEPWHVRHLESVHGIEWMRAMDWGRTAPGVVLWLLLLPDGRLHVHSELKFIDQDIPEVVSAITARETYLGLSPSAYRFSVCDRALFAKTQNTGEPIAEQFQRLGMRFRPSISERMNGWERVRSWLRADAAGPKLTVDPSCRYLIRTIPMAESDPHNPEDIDFKDDHALDTLRYACMSRPSPWGTGQPSYAKNSVGAMVDELRRESTRDRVS